MSLVNFREIKREAKNKNSPKTNPHRKLSFKKLVAVREKIAQTGSPEVKFGSENDIYHQDLYGKGCTYLSQAMSAVTLRKSFPLEPGFRILREMAEVDHCHDKLFIIALHGDDQSEYMIHHSVNVAIYALKMAQDLGFDKAKKLQIGMAALLHEIGTAFIPDKIVCQQEELSRQEAEILRKRPDYSYKILCAFGDEFAYLAESAAQVYERADGSGYPRGLKGDEIHEYARIIGLLDMYECLIHSRHRMCKRTHFAAVKEIINTCKTHFQREHLKSLLSIFTAFPIHSYVRLNSDAIGKVIETYADQPMRPKLQIIYDSKKRKIITERIVVLSENPLLNIVDSVTENEMQALSEKQPGLEA